MFNKLSPANKALLAMMLYFYFKQYYVRKYEEEEHEVRRHQALHRRKKTRESWAYLNTKISDVQFRRMFRMERSVFQELYRIIIAGVGESAFKSESYINEALRAEVEYFCRESSMYRAHLATSGGYIPGEVKLAICLRLQNRYMLAKMIY